MSKTVIIGLGSSKIQPLAYIAKQPLENVALHFVDTAPHRQIPAGVRFHHIGKHVVNGSGCAGDVTLGKKAAAESTNLLWSLIPKKSRVVLLASMAGGTGAGALPTMLRLADEKKARTVGVITMPLMSEGEARRQQAAGNLKALPRYSDQLNVITQASLQPFLPSKTFIDQRQMFSLLNSVSAWQVLAALF